jgi:hypothetical protein
MKSRAGITLDIAFADMLNLSPWRFAAMIIIDGDHNLTLR